MQRTVLAVALLALLAGCSALPFGGPPPSDDRAVEAIDAMNDSVDEVDTYRFELSMRVSATDRNGRSQTETIAGNGSVDVPAKQSRAVTRLDGRTRHSYVDGDRAYQECEDPWGYAVENASTDRRWASTTPLHRQLALFERSNVYWRGNRTLDGNRTVLVVAYPTADTLQSLPDRRRAGGVEVSRWTLENATARLWVDPDTNRPVRSKLTLEIEQRGATATAHMTVRYRDYDEPVDVSIPAAARDDPLRTGCPGD